MKLHNDATTSSLKERYILSSKTNFFMGSHHTTGKQLHYCIGRFSAGTHADTRTSSFAQSCDATHVTNVTNALNNRIVDSFFFESDRRFFPLIIRKEVALMGPCMPFGCAMCSPHPSFARVIDAPRCPRSSLPYTYIYRRTHRAPTPTRIDRCDGRRDHGAGPYPGVVFFLRRRRHAAAVVAGNIAAGVRGVPVGAGGRRRGKLRVVSCADAAGVRARVPRGLHRQVAASAPRVSALPLSRAARGRERRSAGREQGRSGDNAWVGAAGEDRVRLWRREGRVDTQPVRPAVVV
jgi:hypothetical protein